MMKKLFTILAILVMAISVNAATLKWDAVPNADGYKVYYTNGTDSYSNLTTTNELSLDAMNIPHNSEWTFEVTAYNASGESLKSIPLTYTTEVFEITENPKPAIADDPAVENLVIE